MTSEELEIEFSEAVERVNAHTERFPADMLLRLYAYYKKAFSGLAVISRYYQRVVKS